MVRLKNVLSNRTNRELFELYKKINNYLDDKTVIEYSTSDKTRNILILYLCDKLSEPSVFEALALASFSHEYYNLVALLDNSVFLFNCQEYVEKYGVLDDECVCTDGDCVIPVLYEKWLEWGIVYIGVNTDGEYFLSITEEFRDYVRHIYSQEAEALFDSVSFVYSCCCAMVNINGIVPFDVVRDVYNLNAQGKVLNTDQMLQIINHYRAFRPVDFVIYNNNLVHESLVSKVQGNISPNSDYYKLLSMQADKPFYIPTSAETIFDYDDSRAIWMDFDCLALAAYLEKSMEIDSINALSITSQIKMAFMENKSISDAFEILRKNRINLSAQCIHKEIIRLIMEIKDNIRLRINRGHSIKEMRKMNYDKAKISENF